MNSTSTTTNSNSPAKDDVADVIEWEQETERGFAHSAAVKKERKLRASLGIAKLPVPKVRKSLPGQLSLWGDA